MTAGLSRRRVLTIAAAAGAAASLGMTPAAGTVQRWHGTALGADAELIFVSPDPTAARDAIRASLSEIERLEAIFSLYRSDSELSRLNRTGHLASPSGDLLALMRLAIWFGHRTAGAFDISVQPLWTLLADHFADRPDGPGPTPEELAEMLQHVDFRRIGIADEQIALHPGMAVTLNGIAQGYITDRVADLLRRRGWRDVLINLGETRALDGRTWPVRLGAGPARVALSNAAIATSAGAGTPLSAGGDWHHLMDPRTGQSAAHHHAVTVVAANAVTADALSTAIAVCGPGETADIAKTHPSASIYTHDRAGTIRRIGPKVD